MVKIYEGENLGELNSEEWEVLYRNKNDRLDMKSKEDNNLSNISLNTIDDELEDICGLKRVLICDNYYFKLIYNLEMRKAERNLENTFVGIITIDRIGYRELSVEVLKDAMNILINIIYHKLRKGDVLTKWRENQVLLLLCNLEESSIEVIINRIKEMFEKYVKDSDVILNIKFKKI